MDSGLTKATDAKHRKFCKTRRCGTFHRVYDASSLWPPFPQLPCLRIKTINMTRLTADMDIVLTGCEEHFYIYLHI